LSVVDGLRLFGIPAWEKILLKLNFKKLRKSKMANGKNTNTKQLLLINYTACSGWLFPAASPIPVLSPQLLKHSQVKQHV